MLIFQKTGFFKGSASTQGNNKGESPEAKPRTIGPEKCLMRTGIVASVAVLTIMGYVLIAPAFSRFAGKEDNVCRTRACLLYAYYLERSLNKTADPCDNFYNFVCGFWKTPRKGLTSVGEVLYNHVVKGITSKALNHDASGLSRATFKAAIMYMDCLAAYRDAEGNANTLKDFMQANHLSWPSPEPEGVHPLDVLVSLATRWHIEFLFKVALHKAGEKQFVLIYPGFNAHEFTHQNTEPDNFHQYVELHAKLFGSAKAVSAEQLLETRILVLQKLAPLLGKGKPRSAVFPVLSIKNYTSTVDGVTWTGFLNKHLHKGSYALRFHNVTVNDDVFTSDLRVLEAIDALLSIPHPQLLNYITWKFVERFGEKISMNISYLRLPVAGLSYERGCSTFVEEIYGYAFTTPYTWSKIREAEKNAINALLHEVTNATWHFVRASSWSTEAKDSAVGRIADMQTWLWVTDKTDYSTDLNNLYRLFAINLRNFTGSWIEAAKDLWYKTNTRDFIRYVATSYPSGSSYLHYLNSAILPATLAFQPLYDADIMDVINYAGLGSLYAETIAHAFDSAGIMFDSANNVKPWMSGETLGTYTKKLDCYGDRQGTPVMWSSIGMESSFRASRESRSKQPYSAMVNLTSFSVDQLFFAAYCFPACGERDRTPNLFTVRSKEACMYAMQNSQQFAEAFYCAPGTKMNPANKCTFWT
ncbi:neprilysin-1-like isoform X1 [Ornithodoros turicata]|uniref:neprilysin-1-like isoform X1 n=1 Tax=Ornithodoros turicata TaxID=34597 RepID=UPI003139F2C9